MSQSPEDPQQRLAEALRAQATRAPGKPPENTGTGSRYGMVGDSNFGLLSGTEYGSAYQVTAPVATERTASTVSQAPSRRPPAVVWALLLALLLGVLAGAVAGVITLL